MAMADVDGNSLPADSLAKSFGLVWGLAASGAQFAFNKWTRWTLAMASP